MINLSPWYYRNLLVSNSLITSPEFFEVDLLDNTHSYEAIIYLKDHLRPSWVSTSVIYKNCDGSGTAIYKNIAVYKAISEALERLAFYELADTDEANYCFDLNPTTTGMAAYPFFSCLPARKNAMTEAVERWAIHEFNRSKLPITTHPNAVEGLTHYELLTPFANCRVSLLSYKSDDIYVYGFAGGQNLKHSFDRALVELDRNIRVLNSFKKKKISTSFESSNDRAIFYYSTEEGFQNFLEKILKASKSIINSNPKVLCDKELKGEWSQYTKVWRYLLEDSYFDCRQDHSFFMF